MAQQRISPLGLSDNIKAWARGDGTGTVNLRSSYNVSSITDLGVGNYQFDYEVEFGASTNYNVLCSSTSKSPVISSTLTTSCSFLVYDESGVVQDAAAITFQAMDAG